MEHGMIRREGMGGFLNPPTHPEHTKSVVDTLTKGNQFSMSLSGALESDWLDNATKQRAKEILEGWTPPPATSPDIQEWFRHVMGYFHDCYQSPNGSWNAGELTIDKSRNAIELQDAHAGVHLIRKYYPDFILTPGVLSEAYWGTKPEPVLTA